MKFFVPGVPAPKGSARAFFVKNLGRAVITNANAKTRPWEQAIRVEAGVAGCVPTSAPILVRATFRFPRLKGHFTASGAMRTTAPAVHVKKPDLDKLARTLLDALSGVAFVDDAQVNDLRVTKRFTNFGEQPGVEVEIEPAGLQQGE